MIKKNFILLTCLITTYIPLESASKQERSFLSGSFPHIKNPFIRHELEERQRAERRSESELENRKRRIADPEASSDNQSKSQEKEIRRRLHQQY